jgi:hypothetical protein
MIHGLCLKPGGEVVELKRVSAMVLPLDAVWFGVLILVLAVFCTAPLMSTRVFWILILFFIVMGLALTVVSAVGRRRRGVVPVSDETRLLEFLRTHGIGGSLSEVADSLGMTEERTIELIMSLEAKGEVPAGSWSTLMVGTDLER